MSLSQGMDRIVSVLAAWQQNPQNPILSHFKSDGKQFVNQTSCGLRATLAFTYGVAFRSTFSSCYNNNNFLPAAFEYLPVAAGNKIADKTDAEPRPLRRF